MASTKSSAGRRALRAHLKKSGIQDQAAAAVLGIAKSTMSMILSGEIGVGLDTAVDIHNWSAGAVPFWLWLSPKTRREFEVSFTVERRPVVAVEAA